MDLRRFSRSRFRAAAVVLFGSLAAVVGSAVGWAVEPAPSGKKLDFNREVKPILAANCFSCHGPDDKHREGGLRLDQRAAALKPADGGAPAIVPAKPDESELLKRVVATGDERMPPMEHGAGLTAPQVAVLKTWIEQGAEYADHWSFVPPTRRAPPALADAAWCRNGVDRFILARLRAEGMTPSPEADRPTLLRRLSLDLRGLPASPAEIDAFVADHRPDAYEQWVDRFLADPAYGERMARGWLDLARYADSAGYGSDPLRTIWPYRDWVVDAYNRNLPFDRFTLDQLAGDLTPDPTPDRLAATGFHRNTMTNTEGGTDDEEFRVAAVKDRIDTTMQVWMGLTAGCAKCHNHKYDPLSQREYYSLFAFFNQTEDYDQPDESPFLQLRTPEYLAQLAEIDGEIVALRGKLATPTPATTAERREWEAGLKVGGAWTPLLGKETAADGVVVAPKEAAWTTTAGLSAPAGLKQATGFRLEVLPDPTAPKDAADRFVVTRFTVEARPATDGPTPTASVKFVRVELPGAGKLMSLAEVEVFAGGKNVALKAKARQSSTAYDGSAERAVDGVTDGDYFKAKSTTHTDTETDPWWEVELPASAAIETVRVWNRTDNGTGDRLAGFRAVALDADRKPIWSRDALQAPAPSLEINPSGGVAVTFAAVSAEAADSGRPAADLLAPADPAKGKGWGATGRGAATTAAVFAAAKPLALDKPTEFVVTVASDHRDAGGAFRRFRVSIVDDPALTRRAAVPADVRDALDLAAERRTPAQTTRLDGYFQSVAASLADVRAAIDKLEKSKPPVPTVPVLRELSADKRRSTTILEKGNFLVKGDGVTPTLPAAFPALPAGAAADRQGLAHWLVAADNPLTARVAVNRQWAALFGVGLVATEEDFGTQGDLPSHPELLDWLAVEFQHADRWDVKRFQRLLVTSATYRQSSRATPEQLTKDAGNRLLGRAPRIRLEAELVRDQSLALAGLLSRKMRGPSVFPPQPDGLWQAA
ncbi:MAG: DUF1549 domain-containing protein, partial [Planctomycetia bacterium]